jgi:ubiquitin-like protein Pup
MNIHRIPARGPDRDALLRIPRAADQTQSRKGSDKESSRTKETRESKNLSEKGKKLKEEMDELVDEIDEVLEENAEEFVKNYIQRGGE